MILSMTVVLLIVMRVALAIALAGSLWAALAVRCQTCKAASGLAGGLPLGWIGAGLYAALLASTFLPGIVPTIWILAAAAGGHIALLVMLLRFRLVCRACIVTAAGALAATAVGIAAVPSLAWPALIAVPVAAWLTWRIIQRAQISAARRSAELAQQLLAEAVRGAEPVPQGQARLVILSRPDCKPCEVLDASIVPVLTAEFKDALQIEHRPARPGIPTPTLLVLGQASTPLLGLPPAEEIAMAIRMALGQLPMPPMGSHPMAMSGR